MTHPSPALIIEACEFWFVWTKTGHIPRKAHNTQASAEAEADRLASLKPHGKKYIVLKGFRKCHVARDVGTKETSLAGIGSAPLAADHGDSQTAPASLHPVSP